MNKRPLNVILIGVFLIVFISNVQSQDSTKSNDKLYRVTVCWGIGGGDFLGDKNPGIAGSLEYEVQKQHHAISLGVHAVGEFDFLGTSLPSLSITDMPIEP